MALITVRTETKRSTPLELFDATEIIDSLPVATLLIDTDERIIAQNSHARNIFDAVQPGRHYLSVIRQPDATSVIEQCIMTKKPTEGWFEQAEAGKRVRYQISCRAILNQNQKIRILVSVQDISDQHSAGQMRRDFVANVSHELRTPLTALLGFIETLRSTARDDSNARERFLSIMEREANRMNRLIGDLLSLSRIESQERQRPRQVTNLHAALQASVDMLAATARSHEVSLKLQSFSKDVPVLGDADQLQQMFTNLIENAIKYGRVNSMVTIAIHAQKFDPRLRGDGYQVEVIDQGDGIAEEHLSRLMERFYRVDNHRSREIGGTGLGLAIVKHIINRHRGHIRVQSKKGTGSNFTVTLPAALPAPQG